MKSISKRVLVVALASALFAGCAEQPVQVDAMALFNQGRYEEAVGKLAEAVRRDPGNMELRKDLVLGREQGAMRLVAVGNAERAAERLDHAEFAYRRALAVDPGNGRAKTGLDAVSMDRRHAAILADAESVFRKGDTEGAVTLIKPVLLENPTQGRALQLNRQISDRKAREQAAEPSLSANFQKPVTLQFRDANLRMVFESISRTSGINILLDKDVRTDLKTTIFVKGTSVDDTIGLILMQNQLEKKVLSDNTIFIYPNVPAKTKDYQELKVRSFHLVNADAKQIQAMIKTILKTRDLFIYEKTNSLVMRDTPEAIRLAEKIIADQDIAEPEVMLEVEVLEIARTRLQDLGIRYPDQLTLTPLVFDPVTGAQTSTNLTLGSLANRNRNNLLVSPIPTVTFNAHLEDTDTNVLASPRIRARNREKAKIHIGDRVPVLTNSVTPVATGAPVVTGTVSYIDVGLKLEVEPDIHSDGEVGIKVSMEVSNIVNQITNAVSGTVAYQIGTRTASTVLRLKDGETQVLAGLIDDEDRRAATRIPGLGELPVLGRLFSSHHTDKKKNEIVLSITPRIVGRTRLREAQSVELWSGTENTLRSLPLSLRQPGVVSVSTGSSQLPARTTPLPPRLAPPADFPPPPPPGQPLSFSWEGPAQARVGDKFVLTLVTRADEPLRSLGLQLMFDSSALKAIDAVEGDFLKQQSVPSTFSRQIDQAGGQIGFDLAGVGSEGVRGSGSVAAFTFEVLGPSPQSQISVARLVPAGPSGQRMTAAPPEVHTVTLTP